MMLTILSITIALFIWSKLTPDIVALLSLLALYLSGILTLEESLSGFNNNTVILIGGLFIVGEAMASTGWTALAGQRLIKRSKGSSTKLLGFIIAGSGLLSGFVSNTGTVATLMPVVTSSAWNIGTLPSKMLIPLAFGSNTGGLLTLTGTPPNIIANSTLEQHGGEHFSFFEFGLIGLPLMIVALLYFRFLGQKLLPNNQTHNKPVNLAVEMDNWLESYNINQQFYYFRITQKTSLAGNTLGHFLEEKQFDFQLVRIQQARGRISVSLEQPSHKQKLNIKDVIVIQTKPEEASRIADFYDLEIKYIKNLEDALKDNVISQEFGMTEVLVSPKSRLVGRTMKVGEFFDRYNLQLLGVQRLGKAIEQDRFTVQQGDSFLVRGTWSSIENLVQEYKNLVVCGSPEQMHKNVASLGRKSIISLLALFLMIALMVFKLVPNSIAVMMSSALVVLTGCLPKSKIYKSINWVSLIMIAGMIPMGLALQKTGVAQSAADTLVSYLGGYNPTVLLAGIFLLTCSFSQVINNSATALIMMPIAVLAANSLGLSPKPFIVIVAVSASTAFLTPVGTTTNAMVMVAGGYKFIDYFKVGFPLLVLFLTVCLVLVPTIWPF